MNEVKFERVVYSLEQAMIVPLPEKDFHIRSAVQLLLEDDGKTEAAHWVEEPAPNEQYVVVVSVPAGEFDGIDDVVRVLRVLIEEQGQDGMYVRPLSEVINA
jgi:hypothetical protein